MCGITGLIHLDGAPVSPVILQKMTDAIAHRGPDGEGHWIEGSVGISTRPGTHAVHMLGYYRDRLGLKAEDFPGARDCNDDTMAIPLHNRMTEEDYKYVAQKLQALT